MAGLFRIIKSTVFLGFLCITLAVSTAGLFLNGVHLAAKVAAVTTSAAAAALRHKEEMTAAIAAHRKDKAKAVARTKARERAKARVRRFVIAGAAVIPAAGIVAAPGIAGYFESADFEDWKKHNPEGTFSDYACEAGEMSAEMVDDVLLELPDMIRPSPDAVRSKMPQCGVPEQEQPWNSTMSVVGEWMPSLDGLKDLMPSIDDVKGLVPDVQSLKGLLPTVDEFQDWIPALRPESPKGTKDTR
ncbi:MAG: hypothetical protein F4145_01205 [Boseongicola sp. SB0675_bin_26]|nr:hypothetical protein [Boseongicola sp. SB0675_bin_26]